MKSKYEEKILKAAGETQTLHTEKQMKNVRDFFLEAEQIGESRKTSLKYWEKTNGNPKFFTQLKNFQMNKMLISK